MAITGGDGAPSELLVVETQNQTGTVRGEV